MKRYFIFGGSADPYENCAMDGFVCDTDDLFDALRVAMEPNAIRPYHGDEPQPMRNADVWDSETRQYVGIIKHHCKEAYVYDLSDEDDVLFRIGLARDYKVESHH